MKLGNNLEEFEIDRFELKGKDVPFTVIFDREIGNPTGCTPTSGAFGKDTVGFVLNQVKFME